MKFLKLFFLVFFLSATLAYSEKFYPDDPVWNDPDQNPIPKPAEIELSQIYDLAASTFGYTRNVKNDRAKNINTLGEVPDSSWFTNRIGRKEMSIEDLLKGPNQRTGPDISQPWVITRAKTQGITPGFTIKDAKGDTYFIKFDPVKYPQLATSTEVIVTKFFHAFGYNVPENYLARIRREQIQVSPEARLTDEDGVRRQMTDDDVDLIFRRVPKLPDGTIQVVASYRLEGEPIGPFEYWGTRSDDPNDIFPHQDRRELRGMRVFSAWLNHDDSRSINSLDMYVTENDKGYVRHNLIDFGSTLGSGSVKPQGHRAGNEYIIEWDPIFKSAATFGIWDRSWRYIDYPDYPAIDRFEGDYFQPEKWKPEYPNAAFIRMRNEDAFWATRIVLRFTDEIVGELVRTGDIIDKEAEEYLIQTLIKRRDKTIRYYLTQMNPLDEFAVSGSALSFENLGIRAGISQQASYSYQWFRFDNENETTEQLGAVATVDTPSIPLPAEDSPYLMVRIQTVHPEQPNWKNNVAVYVRNGSEVVGIERE